MDRKLLFLDLDGTLLNDEGIITEGNRVALEAALARGHGVVIATGRPLSSALDKAASLGLDKPGCYVISFNGALIYDFGRQDQVFRCSIPRDVVRRVFDKARELDLHIQTYEGAEVLAEPWFNEQIIGGYCKGMVIRWRVVEDICAALTEEPAKMLAIEEEDFSKLDRLQEFIETEMAESLECFHSNPRFLEIVKAGMNKGQAVQMLCDILGVPVSHAVAAGDAANDLSMIRAAGIGVAMANGTEEVKTYADYVTLRDNNHDGIAEIVDKFLS